LHAQESGIKTLAFSGRNQELEARQLARAEEAERAQMEEEDLLSMEEEEARHKKLFSQKNESLPNYFPVVAEQATEDEELALGPLPSSYFRNCPAVVPFMQIREENILPHNSEFLCFLQLKERASATRSFRIKLRQAGAVEMKEERAEGSLQKQGKGCALSLNLEAASPQSS